MESINSFNKNITADISQCPHTGFNDNYNITKCITIPEFVFEGEKGKYSYIKLALQFTHKHNNHGEPCLMPLVTRQNKNDL